MRKVVLLILLVASRLAALEFDSAEFEVQLQGLNWGYSDFTAGIDHFAIEASSNPRQWRVVRLRSE